MILLVSAAFAEAPVAFPVRELEHPAYLDALDRPLTWQQVKELSRPTDALDRVALRRAGRTTTRAAFLAATALEVWGTYELARRDSWVALPLGLQAGFTGLCAVLSITNAPNARVEDRAIVLGALNDQRRR
jgi:hypothetical protein